MAIPVKLPVFEGPLDLLLHLIEKNKIDIYDIPIAGITDQYLEYVRQMDREDLDVTSEFLVMAATLLDIKSRMLLPREKDDGTGEEEGDPREELVRRLLEYKMYKYLSEELAVYREQAGVRYFRAQNLPREVLNYRPPINYDELLGDTDLQSLQKIFGEVLRRKKSRRDPIRGGFGKIRREEISLENKTLYIRAYLQAHPRTDFRALLESRESREEVIVTFLILLELMKTQKVHIVQDSIGGAILVEAGAPENPGARPEDAPPDTAEDMGEPVDSSHEAFESTEDESGGESSGLSSDSLSSTEESSSESDTSLSDISLPDTSLSDSSLSDSSLSDIKEGSAPISRAGAAVSPVCMPLTAFHRMEIVASAYPPEGLFQDTEPEAFSQAGDSFPASDSGRQDIDNPEAVIAESFSSDYEAMGLEQSHSSAESDSGLEQHDSSAESDSGPVRDHFSAHLWGKDPCCRAQYFRAYSGKADYGKIRQPRQWMRTRMARLWARRFF